MSNDEMANQRHVITAVVENKPGVLAHIAGLFSGRGFNIDSLAVGETEDPRFSRMTIAVRGDETILEQIRKQLERIIDVIKVSDLTGFDYVERDLALIRVNVPPGRRSEIIELVHVFRARIVDVGAKDLIIEISGAEAKVVALMELLRPYGIREMARTGTIAMIRGTR